MYRFQSKAAADVLMLDPSAQQILALLGREPISPGIVPGPELPDAIARLEQAVREDEEAFERACAQALERGEPAPRREGISLRQRAWPLLELMRHSVKAGQDLVWGL